MTIRKIMQNQLSKDNQTKDYAKSIVQRQNLPYTSSSKKSHQWNMWWYACPKYGWTFLKTTQNGFVCFYQGASIPILFKKIKSYKMFYSSDAFLNKNW